MPLDLSFLLPNKHPDNLLLIQYFYTWKFLVLLGVISLNMLFGCAKANFDLDVLNEKLYA